MKKILLSVFVAALSCGAVAQERSTPKDTIKANQQVQTQAAPNSTQQAYIMQDGKMYQYNNGIKSKLSDNVTLSNGIVITSTGSVTKPDGITEVLKNGQYVDPVGNIGEWNNKK